MKQSESEALGRRIVHFFENEGGGCEITTRCHFLAEGICRNTINNILERYKVRGTVDYNKKPGRTCSKSTPAMVERVRKLFTNNPNQTVRPGAQKLDLKRSTLSDIKVHKLGIKAFRKETAPKYVNDQEHRAKVACRKIYRKRLLSHSRKVLLMDDETYVPVDPDQVPGMEFYHCQSKSTVSDQCRFKRKTKFPKKFLVWQCLDEDGNVSEPYICTGSINGDIYLKKCIQTRLMSFIEMHHKVEDVLFWPDMATCHYRGDVTEWLKSEKVDFIEKSENAPNVPQARPIERFWALCKKAYKARKVPAKSLSSFKRIWKNISMKVAKDSARTIMKDARKNLRAIGYSGVLAPYKL